jgi:hypothetical protein
MQFSLSKKWTAKEVWDTIAAARISSDCVRNTTLQILRKKWENLTFNPGEDIDDFALCLNTLLQKMVQFGDDTYDEKRAAKKLFHCIPEERAAEKLSAGPLHDVNRRGDRSPQGR